MADTDNIRDDEDSIPKFDPNDNTSTKSEIKTETDAPKEDNKLGGAEIESNDQKSSDGKPSTVEDAVKKKEDTEQKESAGKVPEFAMTTVESKGGASQNANAQQSKMDNIDSKIRNNLPKIDKIGIFANGIGEGIRSGVKSANSLMDTIRHGVKSILNTDASGLGLTQDMMKNAQMTGHIGDEAMKGTAGAIKNTSDQLYDENNAQKQRQMQKVMASGMNEVLNGRSVIGMTAEEQDQYMNDVLEKWKGDLANAGIDIENDPVAAQTYKTMVSKMLKTPVDKNSKIIKTQNRLAMQGIKLKKADFNTAMNSLNQNSSTYNENVAILNLLHEKVGDSTGYDRFVDDTGELTHEAVAKANQYVTSDNKYKNAADGTPEGQLRDAILQRPLEATSTKYMYANKIRSPDFTSVMDTYINNTDPNYGGINTAYKNARKIQASHGNAINDKNQATAKMRDDKNSAKGVYEYVPGGDVFGLHNDYFITSQIDLPTYMGMYDDLLRRPDYDGKADDEEALSILLNMAGLNNAVLEDTVSNFKPNVYNKIEGHFDFDSKGMLMFIPERGGNPEYLQFDKKDGVWKPKAGLMMDNGGVDSDTFKREAIGVSKSFNEMIKQLDRYSKNGGDLDIGTYLAPDDANDLGASIALPQRLLMLAQNTDDNDLKLAIRKFVGERAAFNLKYNREQDMAMTDRTYKTWTTTEAVVNAGQGGGSGGPKGPDPARNNNNAKPQQQQTVQSKDPMQPQQSSVEYEPQKARPARNKFDEDFRNKNDPSLLEYDYTKWDLPEDDPAKRSEAIGKRLGHLTNRLRQTYFDQRSGKRKPMNEAQAKQYMGDMYTLAWDLASWYLENSKGQEGENDLPGFVMDPSIRVRANRLKGYIDSQGGNGAYTSSEELTSDIVSLMQDYQPYFDMIPKEGPTYATGENNDGYEPLKNGDFVLPLLAKIPEHKGTLLKK